MMMKAIETNDVTKAEAALREPGANINEQVDVSAGSIAHPRCISVTLSRSCAHRNEAIPTAVRWESELSLFASRCHTLCASLSRISRVHYALQLVAGTSISTHQLWFESSYCRFQTFPLLTFASDLPSPPSVYPTIEFTLSTVTSKTSQ